MKRFLLILLAAGSAHAANLANLPAQAVKKSQITAPESRPFHLMATVANVKDPSDQVHTARIEEFWRSPRQWRRTVTAPGFSQLLIVNGAQVYEEMTGDYHPNWLRTLTSAIFDAGAPLKGVDLTKSDDNPVLRTRKICRRFSTEMGIAPTSNDVFSSYCFLDGLLESIVSPGYSVTYEKYAPFEGHQVARTVRAYVGREIQPEAHVTELTVLKNPDESLFAVPQPHPPLRTVIISEQDARGLAAGAPPIAWPALHEGQRPGVASIYLCIDREGHVRETLALNNDDPDMADIAREQLMRWTFKPLVVDGAPAQAETILTFGYGGTRARTAP